jgi:hypothetical protein
MARATTDGCVSIDVRDWHREGLLRAGNCFPPFLNWMGEPTEGIAVHAEADSVALMFRSRSFAGEYGPRITQCIPITWIPCAFGGRRPWFRCEVYSNGECCGRRVAILYSAGGIFACRPTTP